MVLMSPFCSDKLGACFLILFLCCGLPVLWSGDPNKNLSPELHLVAFASMVFLFFACLTLCVCLPIEQNMEQEQLDYEAFYQRSGGGDQVKNPDRIRRLWKVLSSRGRASIQNHEDFLREEDLWCLRGGKREKKKE